MKFYFLEHKDALHYSARVDEVKGVSLYYSRIGTWSSTVKAKKAVTIVPFGDDYTITFRDGKAITLDVCQLKELALAIEALEEGTPKLFSKYEMVKRR